MRNPKAVVHAPCYSDIHPFELTSNIEHHVIVSITVTALISSRDLSPIASTYTIPASATTSTLCLQAGKFIILASVNLFLPTLTPSCTL